MTATMTPRQRLEAAFARQEVDRPPVWPNFIRWIRPRIGAKLKESEKEIVI